jgi:CRP-like cAMP-binding protein
MAHADRLIRRLCVSNRLDPADLAAITALPIRERKLDPGSVIVQEGDRTDQCCLIVDGFAYRSKTTDDGKRQIISIHMSGDIPDLQSLHLHVMDAELRTATRAVVGLISHDDLRMLNRMRPTVAEALWRETLIEAATYREWIVRIGRRQALSRVAHLIAELAERMTKLGLIENDTLNLPMTQYDLADAVGLTPVHANRVVKTLREAGVLDFRRNMVRILDHEKLRAIGGFHPLYLHQSPEL